MITHHYVRTLARYNAWQNHQIGESYLELVRRGPGDQGAWEADRGVFWGSIQGTLNHLLWGDYIWMARFEGTGTTDVALADSAALYDEPGEYWEARCAVDKRILNWAHGMDDAMLGGDLTWYSGAAGRDVTAPLASLVVHFFNHQTHHRGQVHAMLSQAGVSAPVTDLFLMPQDGPWLAH